MTEQKDVNNFNWEQCFFVFYHYNYHCFWYISTHRSAL